MEDLSNMMTMLADPADLPEADKSLDIDNEAKNSDEAAAVNKYVVEPEFLFKEIKVTTDENGK